MEKFNETPLMKQYYSIKSKYPNTILLFRVGDFYEAFAEDAIKCSKILGIVLTKKSSKGKLSGVELSGFPYHSIDTYLPKLVQAGERVAVCEQLEKPSREKKVVKRGVIDLVTPGLTTNDKILETNKNNFLASIHFGKEKTGVSIIDISTGEFYTYQGHLDQIKKIINNFSPKEIIFERKNKNFFDSNFTKEFYTYCLEDWVFKKDFGREKLINFFNVLNLKGFGLENQEEAIISAGAILQYLEDTNNVNISHVSKISKIPEDKYVWIDTFTSRNLELYFSNNVNGITLLDILDRTLCPMGARMIKRWVSLPLKNLEDINKRQYLVSIFYHSKALVKNLREKIKCVGDLERWCSRISNVRISPKELNLLKGSLRVLSEIKEHLHTSGNDKLAKISQNMKECADIVNFIDRAINEEAPNMISRGNVINKGVDEDLDRYRNVLFNSKELLDQMLERESQNTNIPSLKIGFNNVFGYYLEVTKTHKDKVPDNWEGRQTLTNVERYVTPELKKFEQEIFVAEEKIQDLESKLYYQLIDNLKSYIGVLQQNANILAKIDCLVSFAFVAGNNNYSCPEINESDKIEIKNGRHPIIETVLPIEKEYIANDVYLDREKEQILIITGPNMSGKSAFLRQTAIITLMAQMGSFVPCEEAKIGIVDKVFSRVGASDNISSGESTFMVEMNETANILNNLSEKSLIILDEIGRGTSTYDGISIAWAITEYLHECKEKPKTIFATHYHELNDMEAQFDRIKNYNVAVKDLEGKIFFTRKLERGGSEHSFGIHVAEMAGIPNVVINRANEVLENLENKKTENIKIEKKERLKLDIFEVENPNFIEIRDYLKKLNVESLTPIEAIIKLNELKGKV